jgi:hypothetical protein
VNGAWTSAAVNKNLLAVTLVNADHIRSFRVQSISPTGWETCESDGQHVVERRRHTDWHRVERPPARFSREIEELREQGWREAGE